MFERFKVFNRAELESRVEIKYESYAKAINIEAKTMIDVASKQLIPPWWVTPSLWQTPSTL